MGRTLRRLAGEDARWDVIGGLDRAVEGSESDAPFPISAPEDAGELLSTADAIIDFSAPPFLRTLLESQRKAISGRALVVGTTGLGDEEHALLDSIGANAPVLLAANFSVGVNLLLSLVERAARALGDEYDAEVVETHHRRKEDAPSGTALALGEAVAAGRGVSLREVRSDGRSGRPGARPRGEIGFHALRGGDVIGEHHVHFIGDMEQIEIVHRASDRALFAAGALHAARWLSGRPPGRYTMQDVLGL
jgi:4-hydroxy-tetrahydrodipicolinate reductase